MLMISWNSHEAFETPEPCEPQYSPILDKMVETGILEVRHVDQGGRMGKRVADPDGHPLWLSVDAEPANLRFLLPGPGRYAVLARDHQGRHLGRNDIFARESGQPDPWRQPTAHERLKDELARERERRRSAEQEARAERAQRLEAESAVRRLKAERDRLQSDLQREKERAARHEEAVTTKRKRRRQAEAALAAEKKRKAERPQPGITAKELMTVGMFAVAAVYYLRKRFEYEDRKRSAKERGERPSGAPKKRGYQTPSQRRSGPNEPSTAGPAPDTG